LSLDINDLVNALDANRKVHMVPAPEDTDLILLRQESGQVHVIDLVPHREKHEPTPRRATGKVTLRNEQSFVAYVNDHKSELTTVILAEERGVTAVFNHHERLTAVTADGTDENLIAGWGDYSAYLELKYSRAWTAWTGLAASGWMPHEDFIVFLEENELDVVKPDGATLRELTMNMRLASASRLESQVNLRNGGTRFIFEEKFEPVGETADGTAGTIDFPHDLLLRIVVFEGGEEFDIPAILRYTRHEGKLKFKVGFTAQKDRIFDDSFDKMCEAIAAGTELRVLRGHI
jgi:uncharacterized protein YfdQ (DUF2303 family)